MSDDSSRPKFMSNRDKTVRLDSVATATEVADPTTKVGLLDLFRAWLRRSPEDRRVMPRHPTYEMQIWIGWCRDEQSFFASLARLVNVSRGGALVNVPDAPVLGKMAWVCLGEPEPKDCIEANILEVRSVRPGEFMVRLEFLEPCPHEFFEAAVCMLPPKTSKADSRAHQHETES